MPCTTAQGQEGHSHNHPLLTVHTQAPLPHDAWDPLHAWRGWLQRLSCAVALCLQSPVPLMSAAAPSSVAAPPAPAPGLIWAHSRPASAALDVAPLSALLAAQQPAQVDSVLRTVFRARNEGVTASRRDAIAAELSIAPSGADALLNSLAQLIHAFLFTGADTKEAVAALFPQEFHAGLIKLLSKLLLANLPEWRDSILQAAVGPPKLVDFGHTQRTNTAAAAQRHPTECEHCCTGRRAHLLDVRACCVCSLDWRVDVKAASNHLANMSVPTVLVDMKVRTHPMCAFACATHACAKSTSSLVSSRRLCVCFRAAATCSFAHAPHCAAGVVQLRAVAGGTVHAAQWTGEDPGTAQYHEVNHHMPLSAPSLLSSSVVVALDAFCHATLLHIALSEVPTLRPDPMSLKMAR